MMLEVSEESDYFLIIEFIVITRKLTADKTIHAYFRNCLKSAVGISPTKNTIK